MTWRFLLGDVPPRLRAKAMAEAVPRPVGGDGGGAGFPYKKCPLFGCFWAKFMINVPKNI